MGGLRPSDGPTGFPSGRGMSGNYWKFLEHFGLLVAFVGFWGAIYRGLFSRSDLARHHNILVDFLCWASAGPWLAALQQAVRKLLGFLTLLYGPTNRAGPQRIRGFLTARAWKMSTWFSALFLFVLPLGGALVYTTADSLINNRAINWDSIVGFTGMLAGIAAALVYSLKRLRSDVEETNFPRAESLIHGGVTLFAVLVAWSATLGAGTIFVDASRPMPNWLMTIAAAILFGGTIFAIMFAIRTAGFFAPLALLAHVTVAAAFFVPLGFTVAFFIDLAHFTKTNLLREISFLPPFAIALSVSIRSRMKGVSSRIYYMTIAVILYDIAAAVIFGGSGNTETYRHSIALVASIPMLFVVPYVLAIYAAIYSNSIPDWFSIALTRHILTRATETTDLRKFSIFLFLDFTTAVSLVILTFLILLVVFYLCGQMMAFAITVGGFDGSFQVTADFFLGSADALPTLIEIIKHWGLPVVEPAREARVAGAVGILFIAAVGATSLIPTLTNAVALLFLIAARVLTILLGPPLRLAHAVLLLDREGHREGEPLNYIRSIAVFGFLIALVLSLFLLPFLAFHLI